MCEGDNWFSSGTTESMDSLTGISFIEAAKNNPG
jgi:hypothetical protein